MKHKTFISILLAFVCSTLLFGCDHKQSDNNDQSTSGSIILPDQDQPNDDSVSKTPEDTDKDSANSSDSDENLDTDNSSDENSNDNTNSDEVGDENDKVDLPEDYVITMSDMERFLPNI